METGALWASVHGVAESRTQGMSNIFTWSQDFMKFRFFTSHSKENSVRDKVIEVNLFRDIYIPKIECGSSQMVKVREIWGGSFYELGNFIG